MALTISVDSRMGLGGKAFRFVSVTHDETTTTFTAASVDLDYIEFAGNCGTNYTSDVASIGQHVTLSIIGNNTITLLYPAKAASITRMMLIGW